MKKTILTVLILLGGAGIIFAAPIYRFDRTVLPEADSLYDLGTSTKQWRNLYISGSIVGGTITPSGLGSSMLVGTNASGALTSTSTPTAAAYLATSTTATSTLLGGLNVGNNGAFSVQAGATANTLVVTTAGRVGIGTTSPQQKLDVLGVGRFSGNGAGNRGDSGSIEFFNYYQNSSNVQAQIKGLRGQNNYKAGQLGFFTAAPSTGTLNERMTIDENGYVGIGTTTPSGKLHVYNGTGDSYQYITSNNNQHSAIFLGNVSDTVIAGLDLNNSDNSLNIFAGNNSATRNIFLSGAGNVGIGTTSPDQKLQVAGQSSLPATSGSTQTGILRLSSNGTSPALTSVLDFGSYNSTGAGWIQAASRANLATNFALLLNPNGGNVGIGTTTPESTLTVGGFLPSGAGAVDINPLTYQASIGGAANKGSLLINGVGSTITSGQAVLRVHANSSSDGNLALFTSNSSFGNPVMAIRSQGNVGIGTTSPVANLHVYAGTSASTKEIIEGGNGSTWSSELDIQKNFQNNSYAAINFGVNGGGQQWYAGLLNSGTSGRKNFSISPDTTDSSAYFTVTNTGNVGIGTTTPWGRLSVTGAGTGTGKAFVVADSANTPRMVVNDNGNVGIGTTTPTNTLTVRTTSNNTGISLTNSATAGGQVANFYSFNGSGVLDLFDNTGSTVNVKIAGTTNGVSYFNAGNVGIGTTSPNAKLNVYSGASGVNPPVASGISIEDDNDTGISILTTNTSQGYLTFGNTADSLAVQLEWDPVTDIFSLGTANAGADLRVMTGNNTEAMRILDSGEVGIGTTNPGAKLEIDGAYSTTVATAGSDIGLGDAGGGNPVWGLRVGASPYSLYLNSNTGGIDSNNVTFLRDGRVGIGTTSPVGKLHVSAGASATTTISHGEIGSATSKACYNTKNTAGADVSWYIVGTTMVIENNLCR